MDERIVKFIDNNPKRLHYKIVTDKGLRIATGSGETVEDMKEFISQDYDNLDDGRYKLFLGTSIQLAEIRSVVLEFKKGEPLTRLNNTQSPKSNMNSYSNQEIQEMLIKAKEEGRKEAEMEILKKQVNDLTYDFKDLVKAFEKFKVDVANKFDDLDGEDDQDLLSKGVGMVTKLSEAKEALNGFSL